MINKPNYWKIVRIEYDDEILYKVLGHWLCDESWQLNSGIESFKFDEAKNAYIFYGFSGSVYECNATCEYVTGYMEHIMDGFRYRAEADSKIASIEFINIKDFLK